MAFKQISSIAFIADSKEDLQTLPFRGMGAECYVIENATEYKQNSKGEWIAQTQPVTSEGGSNSAAIPQIQVDWEQMDDTAVDYIKNKPFGISYDEKIKIEKTHGIYQDFLEFPSNATQYTYLVIDGDGKEYYCYFTETDDGSTYCHYLRDIGTDRAIYSYENLGIGGGDFVSGPTDNVYALTNFMLQTIDFINLPIKQLTNLSPVNPVMDPAVTSEGSTEKTGQEAYDYAVSVNNTLLQLIESYNNLIAQLHTKGYEDQW